MLSLYDISVNASKKLYFTAVDGLRFSWKLKSDEPAARQVSYRLRISSRGQEYYDSGTIRSGSPTEIEPDVCLPSRTVFTMTVEVTDNHGNTASARREFATALGKDDFCAQWIRPSKHIEGWAPYMRTKFSARDRDISRAVLYVSGLGCGEYYINGKKIADDYIDPPMTNYEKSVFFRAYDVGRFLKKDNAFAAFLGEGWYSQSRVWDYSGMKYGDCCLWAQLEIEYDDGQKQIVATNDSEDWKYKYGPVVLNNLYGGENYDARLETDDFALADGDDDGWGKVVADSVPKGRLKLCEIPPVRIIREIPAVSVRQVSGRDDGAWVIDMGENFAGFARFRLPRSPRGAQYVFRFAETVNPDGSLDFRSIGSFATQCIQQDIYIARGDADGETWEPRFTYHAFRYIEITGFHDPRRYGTDPGTDIAVGYALSTDLEQTGRFTCSDGDINRLQAIMMSTFRSNYHGFPEDCPGREKCGWLGDAQIVCNTGMMNYDLEACYEKYMTDIRESRDVYGTWQMIAPGKRTCGDASPLWGCAQVLIPYWMYRYYGDRRVVAENWEYMRDWVEHEKNDSEDFVITRGLGDWCPPGGHESATRIPVQESSTAVFYEICIRMAELCGELNFDGKEYYLGLAAKIKESFNRHFLQGGLNRYSTAGTCGAALATGLFPDGEEDSLFAALLELLKDQDHAMTTGIYGNKYLIPALCERGACDEAYKILFNKEHQSFKTMMDQGATSLWEAPDMILVGTPRDRGTSSYNHPMHSGFAYVFYAYIAGIRPAAPGFEKFEVSPCRFEAVSSADAVYESPYGEIAVSFRRDGGMVFFSVTVPCCTECRFRYGGCERTLLPGHHELIVPDIK